MSLEKLGLPKGMIDIPSSNLVHVIAKTEADTTHPNEEFPLRHFTEEELSLAATSLFRNLITLNHGKKEFGGLEIPEPYGVVNARWNPIDKLVEALLYLPTKFIEMIRQKLIKTVSVEYIWDKVEKAPDGGTIFKGLKFTGLSLVAPSLSPVEIKAGDSQAKVLQEIKIGTFLCEIETLEEKKDYACPKCKLPLKLNSLGEPMGQFSDWDECIAWAENQPDITDAKAYCGYIKAKAEVKPTKLAEVEIPPPSITLPIETPPIEPPKAPEVVIPPEKKPEVPTGSPSVVPPNSAITKELEGSIAQLQKTITDMTKEESTKITKGRKEERIELVEKFKKLIPNDIVLRRWSAGSVRLIQDLKKLIMELEKE